MESAVCLFQIIFKMLEEDSSHTWHFLSVPFSQHSTHHVLLTQWLFVKWTKRIFTDVVKEKHVFIATLNFLAFTWDTSSLSTTIYWQQSFFLSQSKSPCQLMPCFFTIQIKLASQTTFYTQESLDPRIHAWPYQEVVLWHRETLL